MFFNQKDKKYYLKMTSVSCQGDHFQGIVSVTTSSLPADRLNVQIPWLNARLLELEHLGCMIRELGF